MLDKISRRGAGAVFNVTPEGVLVVRWRGIVTLAAGNAVKQAIFASLQTKPAGIVSDYRHAVVAMGDAELVQIMMGGQHDMPELPAVVVASDLAWNAMFRASITAAVSGQWRYASRQPADALDVVRLRLGCRSRARSSAH